MLKLTEQEAKVRSTELKGWTLEGGQLRKTFSFKSFRGSLAFVVQVAMIAETMDHHPDIDIRYDKVTLTLSTHSAGGLTEKDFLLAQEIDVR